MLTVLVAPPSQPTIKEVGADGMVVKTLDRSKLWDVQTPQIIKPDLLRQGFTKVAAENLAVTDDVSIIEALGLPVKVRSRMLCHATSSPTAVTAISTLVCRCKARMCGAVGL